MSSNQRFSTFDTTPFDISSNILASSDCRRMGIPPFELAHRDKSNGGIPILLQPLDAELIGEMPSFLSLSILRHLTFRQISQLLVVVVNGYTTIRLASMSQFKW